MSEKKVVSRNVTIILILTIIILLISLVGAVINYTSIINSKDSTIQSKDSQIQTLTSQKNQIQTWLDENITYLNTQISNLNTQIATKDSQISLLNSQISNLQNQVNDLNDTVNLKKSTVLLENDIEILNPAHSNPLNLLIYDLYYSDQWEISDILPNYNGKAIGFPEFRYAGYFVLTVKSSSSYDVWIEVDCDTNKNPLTYYGIISGGGGEVVIPVLPYLQYTDGSLMFFIKNYSPNSVTLTLSIIYYY
jgi:chaperonin cofactor prefoldin